MNLFYRQVSISEIKKMGYAELKFWNRYHEILVRQQEKAIEGIEAGKKK